MGCGTKLVSIVLFVFTVIFFLVGAALLAAGIWMLVSHDKLFNVLNLINEKAGNNADVQNELTRLSGQKGIVSTAGAILVAVGGLSAFISLFGCLGAVRQSKCLLGIYAGFIIAILLAQIAAAVLAVLYKNNVVSLARSELKKLQDKYLVSVNDFSKPNATQPQAAVSLLFNYMFVALDCCGANSTGDAAQSPSWLGSNRNWISSANTTTTMMTPAACCKVKTDSKIRLLSEARWNRLSDYLVSKDCPVTGVGQHEKYCVEAVLSFIDQYSIGVIAGCSAFAAAQLLVIIFTMCLICSISKD